jgi:hypothetical protein
MLINSKPTVLSLKIENKFYLKEWIQLGHEDQQYDNFQLMWLMRIRCSGQDAHNCIGGMKSSQRELEF